MIDIEFNSADTEVLWRVQWPQAPHGGDLVRIPGLSAQGWFRIIGVRWLDGTTVQVEVRRWEPSAS